MESHEELLRDMESLRETWRALPRHKVYERCTTFYCFAVLLQNTARGSLRKACHSQIKVSSKR